MRKITSLKSAISLVGRPHVSIKSVINQTNNLMLSFKGSLSYDFNNSISDSHIVDSLIVHRFAKKLAKGGGKQNVAYANVLQYDSSFDGFEVNVDSHLVLQKARRNIWSITKNFEKFLDNEIEHFSPGATVLSDAEHVSIERKLFDISHWTVSESCLDDATRLCYQNAALKRAARRFIKVRTTRKQRDAVYASNRHLVDVGYAVFSELMKSVFTICNSSRASSVPKDETTDRFINIEPMFNMMLQRCVARSLIKCLKAYGHDIGVQRISGNVVKYFSALSWNEVDKAFTFDAQAVNGSMICNLDYATEDFKNASNSVFTQPICAMFPNIVSSYLLKYRSHSVSFDQWDLIYEPNMLSSMGNGFTFEVMTTLLVGISHVFDKTARVFGDDVVIRKEYHDQFVGACELLGFTINDKKSFSRGKFRESCGFFYHEDHGYLTSYDFTLCENLTDVIITANKLFLIISAKQCSYTLRCMLSDMREAILSWLPASRKGPPPVLSCDKVANLALYAYDEGWKKKQMRVDGLRELRKSVIDRIAPILEDWQSRPDNWSVIVTSRFRNKRDFIVRSCSYGTSFPVLLPALYAAKRSRAVLRGSGNWVDCVLLVDSSGRAIYYTSFRRFAWSPVVGDRLCG